MVTKDPRRRFGAFTGVFTPTLLTILGVIMYVRLGWVVGNAGLIGAWLILLLALGITVCTGLSLASIATNTRIGDGGPYAVIARSLGLEVAGSVGVPLFLTRPLGIAMYVFGFREGWLWVFPDHDPLAVDLTTFAVLWFLSYKSADLAFRVQFVIMAVIAMSLVSIVASPVTTDPVTDEFLWFGDFPGFPEDGFEGVSFWTVFAVFFPATTGILAGANMSGELKNPRRDIPLGALSAIGLSSVIYFGLTLWAVRAGTTEDLVSNYTIFLDQARWRWMVLAGLLGATASSALAGLVGGPRILMAMGDHQLLPKSEWLAKRQKGEPRNAILLSGVLTLGCLLVRDLNAIAPLVTMFFLITYGVVNLVVLVEVQLGLVSFRPTFPVHPIFPLLGLLGSLFAMFIVSPLFGLLSLVAVVALYGWMQRRGVERLDGDPRSSIFVGVAEWAAERVLDMGSESVRAWRPNLLVPVDDPEVLRGEFNFLVDVVRPEGAIQLLGLTRSMPLASLHSRLEGIGRSFRSDDVRATWSVVEEQAFGEGTIAALQALQASFFRPNMLFLTLPDLRDRHEEFARMIEEASATRVGVALLGLHPRAGLGQRKTINLWLRQQGPDWDIDEAFRVGSLNLTLLMGFRLMRRWDAEVRLLTVVRDEDQRTAAAEYLEEVRELARIPRRAERLVLVGSFEQSVAHAPFADLSVMGLQRQPDFEFVTDMVERTCSTCLMVLDSGRESARA